MLDRKTSPRLFGAVTIRDLTENVSNINDLSDPQKWRVVRLNLTLIVRVQKEVKTLSEALIAFKRVNYLEMVFGA